MHGVRCADRVLAWNITQGNKGGCDGSLILSDELSRGENKGLANIAGYVQSLATNYKVGVADMIGTLMPSIFAYEYQVLTL